MKLRAKVALVVAAVTAVLLVLPVNGREPSVIDAAMAAVLNGALVYGVGALISWLRPTRTSSNDGGTAVSIDATSPPAGSQPSPGPPAYAASASQNPWKVATIGIVAVLVVGLVASGAYLVGADSSEPSPNESSDALARPAATSVAAIPTTRAPSTTTPLPAPAAVAPESDGRLSDSEYESSKQILIETGVPLQRVAQLQLPGMEALGRDLCGQVADAASIGDGRRSFQASVREQYLAEFGDQTEVFVEFATAVASAAATGMCFDLIAALS